MWRNRYSRLAVLFAITSTVICGISQQRQTGRGVATDGSGAQHSSASNKAIPRLVDITASTTIRFNHLSAPEKKYIVESMSGGVALIDYDRDGWPDIYFTNAPDVSMAVGGQEGA